MWISYNKPSACDLIRTKQDAHGTVLCAGRTRALSLHLRQAQPRHQVRPRNERSPGAPAVHIPDRPGRKECGEPAQTTKLLSACLSLFSVLSPVERRAYALDSRTKRRWSPDPHSDLTAPSLRFFWKKRIVEGEAGFLRRRRFAYGEYRSQPFKVSCPHQYSAHLRSLSQGTQTEDSMSSTKRKLFTL